MSVAVAQMPKTPLEPRPCADASTDLLEVLLASCQKPVAGKAQPGFGRELVPYFATADVEFTTPPRVAKPAHAKATATAAAMVAAAKKKAGRHALSKAPAKMTPADAEKARAIKMATIMSSWAGPGFCVSPTPEKLPLPTADLLL